MRSTSSGILVRRDVRWYGPLLVVVPWVRPAGMICVCASQAEFKIIDPEFAFYGPIGFDVGQVIANLLFQYFVRKDEAKDQILADVEAAWTEFEHEFSELWSSKNVQQHVNVPGYYDAVIAKIFKDSIGFAGTELIRRTIGLAHVIDIDNIADDVSGYLACRCAYGHR